MTLSVCFPRAFTIPAGVTAQPMTHRGLVLAFLAGSDTPIDVQQNSLAFTWPIQIGIEQIVLFAVAFERFSVITFN